MRLIVGLGNPGSRYSNTWHNLGKISVERLAVRWMATMKAGRGSFITADARVNQETVSLLIPTSYMNRSGSAVSQWLNYYKVEPEQMLVIYDDHDLPLGRIRVRTHGSSGGHRGIEDILRMTGSDEFMRLKIGISTTNESRELSSQVLSKIPKSNLDQVDRILMYTLDAVEDLMKYSIEDVMAKYNGLIIE